MLIHWRCPLEQRQSRHRLDDPILRLAQWKERLWALGTRRVEMWVCTGCLGQPIRQVALSMAMDAGALLQESGRVYLHLTSTLDEGHPAHSSIACRLLSLLELRFRR
jgi:hypothetical protein